MIDSLYDQNQDLSLSLSPPDTPDLSQFLTESSLHTGWSTSGNNGDPSARTATDLPMSATDSGFMWTESNSNSAATFSPNEQDTRQLLWSLHQSVPDVGRLFDGTLGSFDWTLG